MCVLVNCGVYRMWIKQFTFGKLMIPFCWHDVEATDCLNSFFS
jgi:hypothetical protein